MSSCSVARMFPQKDFDPKAFDNAFKTLLDDLKTASNPHIFVTGNILWANPELDEIKRRVCAEDPSHRTFVDIPDYAKDISANGPVGHPNDKGMKLIADTLFVVIAKKVVFTEVPCLLRPNKPMHRSGELECLGDGESIVAAR